MDAASCNALALNKLLTSYNHWIQRPRLDGGTRLWRVGFIMACNSMPLSVRRRPWLGLGREAQDSVALSALSGHSGSPSSSSMGAGRSTSRRDARVGDGATGLPEWRPQWEEALEPVGLGTAPAYAAKVTGERRCLLPLPTLVGESTQAPKLGSPSRSGFKANRSSTSVTSSTCTGTGAP